MRHRRGVADGIANRLTEIGRLFPIVLLLAEEGLGLGDPFAIPGRLKGLTRRSILAGFQ